ncbi:glycine cleavage system protein GcvH [Budviciaceae bacterium CWB-B4]|uniref:Glycine cleavage system H protein n=1 Tax=Limnobaculum xujianqingii TaxID=2738837 RepID=A0A9D7AIW6_9GAMM|nr:glycine cleavage system protein GcvH [Limnobaculum xujianqingii]MBK5073463.1 glycine cleavage system protein GcvH [Limnobaculum xujianqingii]MBK5176806.1 glycine cleavage system protein GcvH [Limnobaculum xujianqingii]
MSNVPADLKYATSHEWVREEQEGVYTVGITDHAQHLLGDMVFVELPEVGDEISVGEECAVAESVKAASDIYAPLSGEVIAVNDQLSDAPELVNSEPYAEGWLFKIRANDINELNSLLDAAGYLATLDDE